MLRVDNLHKSYKGREVVRGVTMDIKRGEVVGLLGPNGAGKTTCFYMIVGLIRADEGTIFVDETDVTHHRVNDRSAHGLGYLPQDASIFRKLNVRDNILAILEMRKDLDAAGREAELERLMDELQVSHLAEQMGISLSGGERRRVEIARALASNPGFMLLDEPFAGVDPISVGEIQRIVRHLSDNNIGVLITDHNVRETLGICQHAYILNAGEVLAEGTPDTLLADDQVREVYLGREFRL